MIAMISREIQQTGPSGSAAETVQGEIIAAIKLLYR